MRTTGWGGGEGLEGRAGLCQGQASALVKVFGDAGEHGVSRNASASALNKHNRKVAGKATHLDEHQGRRVRQGCATALKPQAHAACQCLLPHKAHAAWGHLLLTAVITEGGAGHGAKRLEGARLRARCMGLPALSPIVRR